MVRMKKFLVSLMTIVLVFSAASIGSPALAKERAKKQVACISPQEVQLKADMQKAWINHTIWTRSYIVSAINNLPDQKYVLERLLRNQQDIGNVFKPYYGEEAGNQLAELLKVHIQIAGQIVEAAKANNQTKVSELQKNWHKNADHIAQFLSTMNPNWTFKEIQSMFYTHLQLITEIVLSCLRGDWQADIAATDKNEIHMIHLADILTAGIVKQFPKKFGYQ